MNLFRERKNPAENMSFMAMMAAVNAVLAVLASWVPFSVFFIVLFLPLGSALVAKICQNKYLIPYVLAASLVAIGVTFYDFETTAFYVIPAIISGTFYGFLDKKGMPTPFLLFLSALLGTGLNYAALPLIETLYDIDMIETAKDLLGLAAKTHIDDIIPCFIYAYSLAEISLSHLLTQLIFGRIGLSERMDAHVYWLCPVAGLTMAALAFGLSFSVRPAAYLFMGFALHFAVFSSIDFLQVQPWWFYASGATLLIVSFFGMAALYQYMPLDAGLLSGTVVLATFDALSLAARLLFMRRRRTES